MGIFQKKKKKFLIRNQILMTEVVGFSESTDESRIAYHIDI